MKKALMIGIDKYLPPYELYECINDMTNCRDIVLKYFGFEVDAVRVLADERATFDNIMDRLRWLAESAVNGDKCVLYYSGHGSQIRDRNGDELRDSLDELICPVDMDWDNGKYITDDMLADIFKNVPPGVLEVIMDCCHSGTIMRNSGGLTSGDPFKKKIKFLRPPIDIECRINPDWEYVVKAFRKPVKDTGVMRHTLWSACKDYQSAYDGAFTPAFCKHIRDTGGKIARRTLLSRIRATLKYNRVDQYPEIECERDAKFKEVFS